MPAGSAGSTSHPVAALRAAIARVSHDETLTEGQRERCLRVLRDEIHGLLGQAEAQMQAAGAAAQYAGGIAKAKQVAADREEADNRAELERRGIADAERTATPTDTTWDPVRDMDPRVTAQVSAALADEWVDAGRAAELEDPTPEQMREFDDELRARLRRWPADGPDAGSVRAWLDRVEEAYPDRARLRDVAQAAATHLSDEAKAGFVVGRAEEYLSDLAREGGGEGPEDPLAPETRGGSLGTEPTDKPKRGYQNLSPAERRRRYGYAEAEREHGGLDYASPADFPYGPPNAGYEEPLFSDEEKAMPLSELQERIRGDRDDQGGSDGRGGDGGE